MPTPAGCSSAVAAVMGLGAVAPRPTVTASSWPATPVRTAPAPTAALHHLLKFCERGRGVYCRPVETSMAEVAETAGARTKFGPVMKAVAPHSGAGLQGAVRVVLGPRNELDDLVRNR